jgi:toxin ParE1/3/4
MPTVYRSGRAEWDAVRIWVHIAENNPRAADRLIHRIEEALTMLADSPDLGERLDWFRPALRRFSVKKYVIYYEPVDDGIRVVRILHSAQQWQDQL